MDILVEPDFRNMEITIVGLGLIGGSMALALRKMNPRKIWAIDVDQIILEEAYVQGIIDGGSSDGADILRHSDLVVMCIYPGLAIQFMKENMANFKSGAVITDTGGIKGKIVREIWKVLREDLDFVGGHPLAGKECSGFRHASADLLMGANYLVTPVEKNKKESIAIVEKMICSMGCQKPIYMSPDKHDEIIALTSQLPHLIATALMNSSSYYDTDKLIGGSFRDATRVAQMNVRLWSELLVENKGNILTQIDIFMDNITRMKDALTRGDEDSLIQLLNKGNQARQQF